MARVRGLHNQYRIRLSIGTETGQVGERRVRTEPEVGVVGANLESTGRDDQPVTRELSADPLTAPPSPSSGWKPSWKLRRVGGPACDDELLEGIAEGDLAVRQLRATFAHDTARRPNSPLGLEVASPPPTMCWGWCPLPLAPTLCWGWCPLPLAPTLCWGWCPLPLAPTLCWGWCPLPLAPTLMRAIVTVSPLLERRPGSWRRRHSSQNKSAFR